MDFSNIFNQAKFEQKLFFGNTKIYGKQFTDFDGVMDYESRAFILVEAKTKGASLPTGQKRCLEETINSQAVTKKAILFVAEHETPETEKFIDFEETKCRSFYTNGKWKYLDKYFPTTLLIEEFLRQKVLEIVEDYSI